MTVLRAHFDGKVFVPDGPVPFGIGEFTLQVIERDADTNALSALPTVRVPPGAKPITSDDVRRALDDEGERCPFTCWTPTSSSPSPGRPTNTTRPRIVGSPAQ